MAKAIGATVIRASAALTTSYVAGTVVNVTGCDEVVVCIAYTMGAAEAGNSVIFKVDWSMDNSTYYTDADPWPNSDAISTGAITVDKNIFTYTADSAAATYDYIAVPISVRGRYCKVSFKEDGVAANAGTCAAILVDITNAA